MFLYVFDVTFMCDHAIDVRLISQAFRISSLPSWVRSSWNHLHSTLRRRFEKKMGLADGEEQPKWTILSQENSQRLAFDHPRRGLPMKNSP